VIFLAKAKQSWLLDSRFKVFKILCGRAVIFHYSLWLKSWENSSKSLIYTIMKILWIFENLCGANCHIIKIFWYLQKKHEGRNENLMINFAWPNHKLFFCQALSMHNCCIRVIIHNMVTVVLKCFDCSYKHILV